jgi:hypothetical protein
MAGMTTSSNDESRDLGDMFTRITAHVNYLVNVYGLTDVYGFYPDGARDQRGDPCGDPPITQQEKP